MPSRTHKLAGLNGTRSGAVHRREIERELRAFLAYADLHPLHRFAAGTQRFLIAVRPIIERLDKVERAGAKKP